MLLIQNLNCSANCARYRLRNNIVATVTQKRTIGNFSRVILRGSGDMQIVQANRPGLTITADVEIIDDITAWVTDDTLHIGYRSSPIVSLKLWRQKISLLLHVVDLNLISSLGSGCIHAADFDSDQLELNLSGSGRIVIDELTADTLAVLLSGSGSVSLAGDVESQKVNIKGSGSYLADNLLSDFGSLRISGSGVASVSVADDLDIVIAGSGKVYYQGFPDLTKQILGSGAVHRVRKDRKTVRAE